MKKNWTKPTVLSLDNDKVNSGGSNTTALNPEYLAYCSGSVLSGLDFFAIYPSLPSLISAGASASTASVIAGACS